MVRLFDGEIDVAYHQFSLETPERIPGHDVERCFAGQTNGLCGAGEAGMLQCTTGLHTGPVPVAVDLLDTAPESVAAGWEEIVEVSLTTTTDHVLLYDWDHQQLVELPLGKGESRVRCHANGLQAGKDADTRSPDDPVLDRYLLQVWPAEPAADQVLRRTGDLAGHWHDTARSTPSPATRRKEPAREDTDLAAFDDLIEDITAAGPDVLRAAARRLALHAAASAGADTLAWLRPALDTLECGPTLHAPFDDHHSALAAVHRDLAHLQGHRSSTDSDGVARAPRASASATLAVVHAANPDPWAAFMMSLNMADGVSPLSSAALHLELRARFLT